MILFQTDPQKQSTKRVSLSNKILLPLDRTHSETIYENNKDNYEYYGLTKIFQHSMTMS